MKVLLSKVLDDWDVPGDPVVGNPPDNAGDMVLIPGVRGFLGTTKPIHCNY